jgi:hypothetical protein
MMTSPNSIQQTEDYIFGRLTPEDDLLYTAKLLTDPQCRMDTESQRKAYALIKQYGRKKLRAEIELIHQRIFADPTKILFRKKIISLFTKF